MKKLFPICVMSALVMLLMGCDKIDIDNIHKPYSGNNGSKTVLIKDFTGVRCVNCPEAAETAHELQHQLGLRTCKTRQKMSGGFRTEEGTLWYNNNAANPLFSVDHVALTEGNTLNVSQLDSPVAEALAEPQIFDIAVENTYDEATRQVRVKNTFSATSDADGKFYATVCLLEDSIVGRQDVPGGIDTAYVFRNVFRGTLNGAEGMMVSNGSLYVNDEFTSTFSMAIDSAYNVDQCYIMTYLYDYETGKIIQTAMEKVK